MELKYVVIIVAIVFLLLIIAGLAIVNYSTDEMVEKFKKVSNTVTGTTPLEFAKLINSLHFGNNIRIKFDDRMFSDCISGNGELTLCSKYANDNSIAGLSVCAHELGHAFQFKNEKDRMRLHVRKLMVSKIASWLTSPLIIGGIVVLILSYTYIGIALLGAGIVSFFVALIAKFSTLKLEKDASVKALELLETYASFNEDELKLAKRLLDSAKQTYVADILRTMLKWTMLVKK